ncbi:MAG: hypothetical protein PUC28_13655, partial [Blautia sp.]|nr:hypothetical protein [Blautia sp.]
MNQDRFIGTERKILERLEGLFSQQRLLTQWQLQENNHLTDMLLVEHTGMGTDEGEVLGCYY